MTRLPDWRVKLTEYLAANARRSFRYGSFDCALFAAGAVRAMTGENLADGWSYRSRKMGERMLEAQGFADHVELAASLLPEVAPSLAQVGDVAAIGETLGIVQGQMVYAPAPQGLALVSRLEMTRAFTV